MAGATPPATMWVPKILMPMGTGTMFRIMAECGYRQFRRVGFLIAMAAGSGRRITAGRGFTMSLGAGRRITMDAGSSMNRRGYGGPDRSTATTGRYGRRLMYRSSDSVADLASVSASATWLGCRLDRVTASIPGMDDMARALMRSTSPTSPM